MIFHEIYGNYFNALADILSLAVDGTLTEKKIYEIVQRRGFGESNMSIPASLKDGSWRLLTPQLETPLTQAPTMPLTILQKRWMKALLSDPRAKLFGVTCEGLEDVKPLYGPDTFRYFDQYEDGDPYESDRYVQNFRAVLQALREKRWLRVKFTSHSGRQQDWRVVPHHLEYSSKDDKFRLITAWGNLHQTINLARMESCFVMEPYNPEDYVEVEPEKETLIMELYDGRNALERAMLHFSHIEKETVKLDEKHYRILLKYYKEDETELLIRVIGFGPMVRVIGPDQFVNRIRQRLAMQRKMME